MTHAKNHFIKLFLPTLLCALLLTLAMAGSAYAKEVEVTDENGFTYTIMVPDAPLNLTPVKTSNSTIKIRWEVSSYWTDNGFEVCTYNASTKQYTHLAYTANTEYTLKNLKKDSKYVIAVREYIDVNGERRFSDYSQKLTALTSPKAPTLNKATYKSKGKINVRHQEMD